MALSAQAHKALSALRDTARAVQRFPGGVSPSRRILEYEDALRKEIERLESERAQLSDSLKTSRAKERQLQDRIEELEETLTEGEWPVPSDQPEPLPPDYWETAQ